MKRQIISGMLTVAAITLVWLAGCAMMSPVRKDSERNTLELERSECIATSSPIRTALELKQTLITQAEAGRVMAAWTHPWNETDSTWRTENPTYASKINEMCGRVPRLYFTDFYYFAGTTFSEQKNLENRAAMSGMIKAVYGRYGSLPVISWHPANPYMPTNEVFYKGKLVDPYRYRYCVPGYPQEHRYVIREILTGTGASSSGFANPREWYEAQLSSIVEFLKSLKDGDGRPIPVIVRLFHEWEDDWMWWGMGSVSYEDYISLFRYTVRTLRERTSGEAELLFAYSPDRYWKELGEVGPGRDFLSRYPGDEWVDIIGFDDYSIAWEKNPPGMDFFFSETVRRLRLVSEEARRRKKACGLFETGVHNAKDEVFYSYLRKAVLTDGVRIAFANTWTGPNTIPETEEGRAAWREYLADPRILTLPLEHSNEDVRIKDFNCCSQPK